MKESNQKKNNKSPGQPPPIMSIRVTLDHAEAVLPTRAHESDSGFDVTVVEVFKKLSDRVTLYNTGLRIAPDEGYYTELVARSSLMKSGYMLANNVGIIDNSYRGPLIVALYKFDENSPELTLPARVAQLIPRQIVNIDIIPVNSLTETVRGDGGFGSTGQ